MDCGLRWRSSNARPVRYDGHRRERRRELVIADRMTWTWKSHHSQLAMFEDMLLPLAPPSWKGRDSGARLGSQPVCVKYPSEDSISLQHIAEDMHRESKRRRAENPHNLLCSELRSENRAGALGNQRLADLLSL